MPSNCLTGEQHIGIDHIGEIEIDIQVVGVADGQTHAVDDRIGPGFGRGVGPAPTATAGTIIAPEHIADGILQLVVDYIEIGVAVVVVVNKGGGK